MLDTNLKKSHKRTNLIIALVVLLPALLLVCLYPQMEKAMRDKRAQWHAEWERMKEENEAAQTEETAEENADPYSQAVEEVPQYYLQTEFVNYAVEASYYQYALLLQEATNKEVNTDVLKVYGWINDYYTIAGTTPYYAEYQHIDEETGEMNLLSAEENLEFPAEEMGKLLFTGKFSEERYTELKAEGLLGYLIIEYDQFGKISDVRLHSENNNLMDSSEVYQCAQKSVEQYQNDVLYYEDYTGDYVDETSLEQWNEVCPKNFRICYLIYQDNGRFVVDSEAMTQDSYINYEPYYSPEELYFATGAYWIVLVLAFFVAIAALILPFFKKLETGWEKLFCMPTEIIGVLIGCGIAGAIGMCFLMSYSTMDAIANELIVEKNALELLGYEFSVNQCYYGLLVLNFLGWAACFFTEYICVAQLRQFFCGPVYYLKNRFLVIRFCRWIGRQCKKLVHYVTDIDINEKLHKSILKVVLANLVVVTVLCCFWFVGIFGVLIYSFLLYLFLKKYGEKLQGQYQEILNATGQMAEGDLKISLGEDLGIFAPLGEELSKVQQGFSKAVAEEAKSQNMKSELITNVSHDLKTPLTAIITYVDLLKNPDITEEERKSYIETLDLKSQRLKVLIEDLFEVSKANSGNVTMNFMDVDIVNLMKEVRVELADKIEKSDLTFRWNLPEEKIILWLDGQRTYRIFENLLNNAIKYAMPFTRVYVDIFNEESQVVITFKNMSAQELNFEAEHLTERFVRGDSARNSEGSGLGLAIAKSFTELQHGNFTVSVDGDLFKVTICFPKNKK